MNFQSALAELLRATTPAELEAVIQGLETRLDWVPLGANADNFGIIKMGSDPFDGLAERITNAMDAMLELSVEHRPELKTTSTPREAIEALYGFKQGNLRDAPESRIGELATDIKVRFLEGSEAKSPTIEVMDHGIGQHPGDFPKTLLSLNSGYKVQKFYLIGAFGQGGQTSFAHCEYGVIVSRKDPRLLKNGQPDLIGWSIVRYRDPSTPTEFFKQGRWEYCVVAGTQTVPTVLPSESPIGLDHGTIIRLVNYNLPKGSSDVLQPASTAWGFLSQSLFDPVLPIRLYEARERFTQGERKGEKNRPLAGLARRLWGGGRGEKVTVAAEDSYLLDLGRRGSVRINYWALSPKDELEKWPDVKKGFVSGNAAVFITLNGQRHSIETTSFIKDEVGLNYASNYLIVQVDCDGLTKESKKNLFSTTRDRLIDSDFTRMLLGEVADHLKRDRNLLAFEKERRDKIISAKSQIDTSKIRRMVGQYISQYPELKGLINSKGEESGPGEKQKHKETEEEKEEEIREEELVPPELKPVPTYLKIANFKDPIPVEKGGSALIRLETDADDSYFEADWEAHFRVFHQTGVTRRKSQSGLRQGKISYYVQCSDAARVGSKDRVLFELDVPGGKPLAVEREVICVKAFDRTKEPATQKLPEPKIIAVTEKEKPEVWNQFGWNKGSVGRVYLGKPEEAGIFVSLDNKYLAETLRSKGTEAEVGEAIKNRYLAGVAFYLLVKKAQEVRHVIDKLPDDPGDDSPELDRLAQTLAAVAIPSERL